MVIQVVASAVLLVVGVSIFVLIHVCIIGRTFGSISRRVLVQRSGSNTMTMSRSGSMSQEDIKKLPSYDFNLEEQQESLDMNTTNECVVCLEVFKTGEKCKILPNCNHSFHGECIDSWLIQTGACPVCRAYVAKGTGESSFSSGVEIET